jgi:NAD(P)H-hydrate epimerase
VEGDPAEAVSFIDLAFQSGKPVLSIDMPSGIDSDTGRVLGTAVRATVTVTLALPKRGHYLYPGASHRGKLYVQDIGIPLPLLSSPEMQVRTIEEREVSSLFPAIDPDSHKGTFGHVLVVAGSVGKSGAAEMTARACLRAGAGLVTLAVPRSIHAALSGGLMEVMVHPLPDTEAGTLSLQAEKELFELSEGKSLVALGPGLSAQQETSECIRRYISGISLPLILDADGIHALAGNPDLLSGKRGLALLTPHPGEMGRLLSKSAGEIQRRRIETVQEFCTRWGCPVLLKGAHTLVGGAGGEVCINTTGNPGMATAGSGDVLTGVVAGFAGRGMDLLSSAKAAVFIHGMAGDLAAEEIGEVGMIAGDILERIPKAIRRVHARG